MFGLFKKKGIDDYERELANLSPRKRKKAADGLGKVKEPWAVQLLVSALRDTAGEVREAAANALGRLGNPAAVQPLIRTLKDVDNSVCLVAAESLMELGDQHGAEHLFNKLEVEPLLRVLNDPNEKDPNETVAQGILGEKNRGMELLVYALKEHPDEEVRRLAALVLTCADDPLATEALTHAQKGDTAKEVREVAAKALTSKTAFCLKCRAERAMRNTRAVTLMNGSPAEMGDCPTCGTHVFRVGR